MFENQQNGESLDKFLQRNVRATKEESKRFSSITDLFVRFLQKELGKHSPFTLDSVVQWDSIGKGTLVSRGSGIKLVVFINGLDNIDKLVQQRPRLLQHLKTQVGEYKDWGTDVTDVRTTRRSITCTINGCTVDIIPAFNLLKHVGKPADIYQAMETDARSVGREGVGIEYSASLAQLQVNFIKHAPGYVKDVMLLLKLWKKEKNISIRSYSLELLTVYVWKEMGGNPISVKDLFQGVLRKLANFAQLEVAFDDNSNYQRSVYEELYKPPYILDPANPFVNTLSGKSCWGISKAAAMTLESL